jgi:methionine-rich copper-binding protein CopC
MSSSRLVRPALRLVAVAFAVVIGTVLVAAPRALAHDVVEATSPADGTTVGALPATVGLTLSDEPLALGLQVVVRGPDGPVQSGDPVVDGRTITQRLAPDAPPGPYTVVYRVTSGDGHPISGSFSFFAEVGLDGRTATGRPSVPAPAPDAEAEAARSSQFVPVVLSVVGTAVILGIAVVVALRARR